MKTRLRAIAALCASLALLALSACSESSSLTPPATPGIVADTGFRPTADGFGFVNYGNVLADGAAATNLTAPDVRTLFGDAVCAGLAVGKCDLIPEAQAWMDATNEQMAGGHCFGFSVAANLVWQGKLNTSTYGAPDIKGLAIDDNAILQRTIARGWAFQLLDSVQSETIEGGPNEILGKLIDVLKPHPSQTYTITLFKQDFTGGHAVTPYAVEYKGDGQYDVLIYDNNWPGQSRAIAFDTNKETWTYQAATNPDDAGSLYVGDAESKSLYLVPTSPGQATHPCPFCSKAQQPASTARRSGPVPTAMIYLSGSFDNHAHVLVTDEAGHRLGRVNGTLVNEIPGARYVLLASGQAWKNKLEPILSVPANVAYAITLDGTPLTAPDTESIRIIGPSWHVAVKNIEMSPGDKDTLVADPNATSLTYSTTRAKSPTIEASVSEAQAHYAFVVAGVSNQPGSKINLRAPAGSGTLIVSNAGSTAASSVDLEMTRSTEQGVQRFKRDAIPLAAGATAELQYGNWTDPSQSIPLVTTLNGQRTTQTLTSQ